MVVIDVSTNKAIVIFRIKSVKSPPQMMMLMPLVVVWIGPFASENLKGFSDWSVFGILLLSIRLFFVEICRFRQRHRYIMSLCRSIISFIKILVSRSNEISQTSLL